MVTQRPLVLELRLPKVGTTALAEYFRCNGWRTSHSLPKHRAAADNMRRVHVRVHAAAAQLGWGPSSDTAGDAACHPMSSASSAGRTTFLQSYRCSPRRRAFCRGCSTRARSWPRCRTRTSCEHPDLDSWVHRCSRGRGTSASISRRKQSIASWTIARSRRGTQRPQGVPQAAPARGARGAARRALRRRSRPAYARRRDWRDARRLNGTKPSCWRVVNSGAPRKHGGSAWRRPAS